MIKDGQRTFNLNLKVSAAEAANVEAEIKKHALWMRDTHSYDNSKIQLVHYYVSKSDELVNFANPEEGTTGNVLFSITRFTFTQRASVNIWMLLDHGQMPPVSLGFSASMVT